MNQQRKRLCGLAATVIMRTGVALCVACVSGCGSDQQPIVACDTSGLPSALTDAGSAEVASTTGAMYSYDLDEVINLQSKALYGDGNAAYSLSEYYTIRKQWPEANYWDQVGAENGSPISAERVARGLWSTGGFHNCQRAIFWLGRAKAALEVASDETKMRDLDDTVRAITQDERRCLWSELRR